MEKCITPLSEETGLDPTDDTDTFQLLHSGGHPGGNGNLTVRFWLILSTSETFCFYSGVGGAVYPLGTENIHTRCCGNLASSCEYPDFKLF